MRSPADLLAPRRVVTIVALVIAWCALWGSISIANVASGLLVSLVVNSLDIGPPGRGSIRIVPLLKFLGLVSIDLVTSTFHVAWEVLTPTDRTEESIIGVHLPAESRAHLLLLVVAVTLTPGTAVVDTDPDTGTIYLHLLHDAKRDETARHVAQLAALACQALPVPDFGSADQSGTANATAEVD